MEDNKKIINNIVEILLNQNLSIGEIERILWNCKKRIKELKPVVG
jgi:hypothetical protein